MPGPTIGERDEQRKKVCTSARALSPRLYRAGRRLGGHPRNRVGVLHGGDGLRGLQRTGRRECVRAVELVGHFPGQQALRDVQAELAAGKAVIAGVNAQIIWQSVEAQENSGTPNYSDPDHALVVIAVDLPNYLVYCNDSGAGFGKAMKVPIGAFMTAWQFDNYEYTVVVPKTAAATT